MGNDNHEEKQKAYWAKDIARLHDISTSNLRKWSIDLENGGYSFYRGSADKTQILYAKIFWGD